MSIINDTKEIIEQIEKIKENLNNGFISNTNLIQNDDKDILTYKEVRKYSAAIHDNKEKRKNNSSYNQKKQKKKYFPIYYCSSVFPYLDTKTILNASLLNKESNIFIKSIYFYKFMNNIREFKKKAERKKNLKLHRKKSISSKNSQVSEMSITSKVVGGFYGVLSGTFSLLGNFFKFKNF